MMISEAPVRPGRMTGTPVTTAGIDSSARGADERPRATSETRRWSRPIVNLLLDAALMVVLAALFITSVIIQFVFPPGIAARGWMLWGLNHSQWTGLQFGILCVLMFGVVVHVMLHWNWVCGVISRQILRQSEIPDDGIRTLYGVAMLIVLLVSGAIITGTAEVTISPPDPNAQAHQSGHQGE